MKLNQNVHIIRRTFLLCKNAQLLRKTEKWNETNVKKQTAREKVKKKTHFELKYRMYK